MLELLVAQQQEYLPVQCEHYHDLGIPCLEQQARSPATETRQSQRAVLRSSKAIHWAACCVLQTEQPCFTAKKTHGNKGPAQTNMTIK